MIRPKVALLVLFCAASGCAASRASVSADARRLSGPVSLSMSVPGPHGEILRAGDDLEVVGRFTRQRTFRAIAWGLLLPWRSWDATSLFNAEMRRYGGEAIVGLSVSTESMSGGQVLLGALAALVPIIPTSITVRISGIVVRRRSPLLPHVRDASLPVDRNPTPRALTEYRQSIPFDPEVDHGR